MNDKGHFLISMTKSGVRILGSVIAIKKKKYRGTGKCFTRR